MAATPPLKSHPSSSTSCDVRQHHDDTTTTCITTDNTNQNNRSGGHPPLTSSLSAQPDMFDHSELIVGSNNNNNNFSTNVVDNNEMNSSHRKNYCCCCFNNSDVAFTDEQLLILAFLSFLTFAIIQMIFAIYVAHSHAMIGDSSVMLLDAMTYLFNGCSERQKQQYYTQYQIQLLPSSQQQQQPEQEQDLTRLSSPNSIIDVHDDPNKTMVNDTTLVGDTTMIQQYYDRTDSNHNVEVLEQEELEPPLLFLRLRQKVILLEIVAPSISVVALIMVTIVVTKQAIHTIQTIESRTRNAAEEPNLYVILFFSIFNLILDGINMYFFTRPKNVSLICSKVSFLVCSCCRRFRRPTAIIHGMDTDRMTDQDMTDINQRVENGDNRSIGSVIQQQHQQTITINHTRKLINQRNSDVLSAAPLPSMAGSQTLFSQEESLHHNHSVKHHHSHPSVASYGPNARKTKSSSPTNLNMCSAYTHVLADTLRSLAVITAVLLALYNDIEPALADATAALIVSFLIALSLIPLLQGLYHNMYELNNIRLQLLQQNQLELPSSSSIEFDESNNDIGDLTIV